MKLKSNKYLIAAAILSAMWIIAAGLYAHNNDIESANSFAKFSDQVCADGVKIGSSTPEQCQKEHAKNLAIWMQGDTGNVLFLALAPLPFFWLGAFCMLYFTRAQIIGFRAVIPWRTLSWQKRVFVIFCGIFVAMSCVFGLLVLLNDYVDSELPVSPTIKSFSKSADGDLVEIVGTWTRTDLTDDTIANPIQTSRIVCVKSENRCTEAKAYLSGNSLFSDAVDYTVQSWTDSAIILRNDFPCATELYTIDLNTELVSGVGYKTNKGQPLCEMSFNKTGPDRWSLLMDDGFKVFWAERQKKRPWLLRVIQSLLGN